MECRHGWLTLSLSFHLSFCSSPFISLSPALSPGSSPLPPTASPLSPPSPTSILSGLIVLHLFIQAFMATSSSRGLISLPDDGFLPQLSRLFIIDVDPHHISLTLGRWFSHWTALLTRHITHPLRSAHKHVHTHTQNGTIKEETSHHYITLQIYWVLKCYVEF